MRLFYRDIGDRLPIIILHGLYGSSDNWMSIGRELSLKHRIILVDLRNHGRSPHSPSHSYPDLVSDILELFSELYLSNAILIGHSMGGKTTMLFTQQYPHLVKGQVIIDISPASYCSENPLHCDHLQEHRRIINAMLSLDLQSYSSRQEIDEGLATQIENDRIRQFLLKNVTRSENGKFQWLLNLDAISKNLENLLAGVLPLGENSKISTPTLFIKGGNSSHIRMHDEMLIKNHFSNYQIQTIHNASHWVHAENPKEVVRYVEDFLKCKM